jgi:hypothetical protein
MDAKKILAIILLLFVVIAAVTVVMKEFNSGGIPDSADVDVSAQRGQENVGDPGEPVDSPDSDAGIQADVEADVDVVYYFMTAQRCPSCMKIESFTKEVVHDRYSEKLSNDAMMWKMVPVDEPQNKHFIQEYRLYTKSVVIVRYRDGKQVAWKNLEKVWSLLGDKGAFQEYITREVDAFIGEG